jgi:hypothetical protein
MSNVFWFENLLIIDNRFVPPNRKKDLENRTILPYNGDLVFR